MQGETPKEKSQKQEKSLAKRYQGRPTLASGALHFDKSDVVLRNIRVECKRTDKDGLWVKKAWLDKLKREARTDEFYAMEVEVQDERIYLIPEGEFRFLKWVLTTPKEEIIKALQEGEYGDL